MKKEMEVRALTLTPQTRETESDDDSMVVEGYAAVYSERALMYESEVTGFRYLEEIAPGAFDGADCSRTVLKYNHEDSGLVLARASNGTLTLSTDEHGLKIRAEIAPTTTGRDLFTLIKRGDLDKMSFAFTVADDDETVDREKKECVRTIKRFDAVYDVSVVDFPAYDATSIEARSDSADYYKKREQMALEKRKKLILLSKI